MNKITNFLAEAGAELKKVVWPTRRELVKLSLIVIIVSLVIGFYLGGVDALLTKGVGLLINH